MKLRTLTLALALLPGLALPATAQQLVRGPYIQMAGPEGFLVCWRTDVPAGSRLRFGLQAGSPDREVAEATPKLDHALAVTGMPAGSTVHYAVGTPAGDLGTALPQSARTSPAGGGTTRAWVLGDGGLPGPELLAVRDAYLAWSGGTAPDLLLLLGDNAYDDGTDAEYQAALFDPFATVLSQSPVWSARGNHERDLAYFDIFEFPAAGELGGVPSGSEAWYSFDHGDIHFLSFDSYAGDLSPPSPMLDWIAADLAANTRPWLVVLTHYPPYSKGTHDSDADWHMTQVREHFLPVLEAGGMDLLLAGHSHGYERSFLLDGHYGGSTTLVPSQLLDDGDGRRPGDGAYRKPTPGVAAHEGAVYVVAGSSSRLGWQGSYDHPAMYTGESRLGSVVIDQQGLEMVVRFLDAGGVTRDHFTLVKGEPVGAPGMRGDLRWVLPSVVLRGGETIRLEGAPAGTVLELLDLRGRRIASFGSAGEGSGWTFRAPDGSGQSLSSGSYVLRARRGDGTLASRVVVVRP